MTITEVGSRSRQYNDIENSPKIQPEIVNLIKDDILLTISYPTEHEISLKWPIN